MTDYTVMPDFEAIVGKAIRDAGYSAYSSIPTSPTWPLCVVQRIGGYTPERHVMDAARIQVDVWGSAKSDATQIPKSQLHDMTQSARVAVHRLEGAIIADPVSAFVSGVEDATGLAWLPDDETGRERYLFTVLVFGRSN